LGPIEATAKELDEKLKSSLTDPLLSTSSALMPGSWYDPASYFKNPEPSLSDKAEDAFDLTIVNLLERISNAPDGKLEPLTTALNAVVQAHDTYTYEEADND
jgi:hypothetical protein